ncbi:MAG: GNAT family N-acetyltransferase, partial [Acutalibacteraceae bacterium]
MNKKKISMTDMYPLLSDIIESNGSVKITVVGISMQPMLYNRRDTVTLSKPVLPLKKYDIPFYKTNDGKFILHRIRRINKDGTYDCRGDNCRTYEKNISDKQIIGVVTEFTRNGKSYNVKKSLPYLIYTRVWPFLYPLKKYYGTVRNSKKTLKRIKYRFNPIKLSFLSGDGKVKSIKFRPAEKSDLNDIYQLIKKDCKNQVQNYGNYVLNEAWLEGEKGQEYLLNLSEKHFFWIALCENKAVGYIAGQIVDRASDNFPIGELKYIFVDEEFRCSGIGSTLVEQ